MLVIMIFAGFEIPTWLFGLIVVLMVWEGVWKLLAMWKAAKNNSIVWFIILAIFNTVGILPILYLYVFSEMKRGKRKIRKRK